MAEEIGTGYVSLVPSLKGFNKAVQRALRREMRGGVEVPVKPVFDRDLTGQIPASDAPTIPVHLDPLTRALQNELRKVSAQLARTVAIDLPVHPDNDGLRQRLTALLEESEAGLAAKVPVEPGDRRAYQERLKALLLSVRETQHVRVEPDYDRNAIRRITKQTDDSGFSLGRFFSAGFQGGLLSPFGITAILVTVISALPFAGALVAATTLAGASIAALLIGGFLLAGDKELQAAVGGLFKKIGAGLKSAAAPLKGPFLEAIGIIAQALRDIAPDVKTFFQTIANSGGIQDLARGIGGLLKSFSDTGALSNLSQAIGPMLSQIGMALPDIGNAISQFLISITRDGNAQTAADFMGKFLRTLADIIRVLGTVFGFLTRIFPPTLAFFKAIWNILLPVWKLIGYVLLGFVTLGSLLHGEAWAMIAIFEVVRDLPADLAKLWDWLWKKLTGGASSAVSTVVGFLRGLPSKIASAVGSLGSLLLNAGKNVVQGLIDGIESKFGSLRDMASRMAQTIRNFLPFSPAKEGPLSGSGNPYHSGQVIAGDLAGGVQSQLPTVRSAADQLAGQFGVGGPQLAVAGGGPGFTIDTAGSRLDQLLVEVLKESIREKFGGDVDLAIGRKARR